MLIVENWFLFSKKVSYMNHTGAVRAGYWRQKADPKVFKSFLYHHPGINSLIYSAAVPEQKLIVFAVDFIICLFR